MTFWPVVGAVAAVAALALGVLVAAYGLLCLSDVVLRSRRDRQQGALSALGAVRGHRTHWTDDDRKIWRQR